MEIGHGMGVAKKEMNCGDLKQNTVCLKKKKHRQA